MISRQVFLKSALGAAALVGLGTGTASATRRLRGSVAYDTGVQSAAGAPLSRVRWSRRQLEREIGLIASELRCPSVNAFGSDLGRLAETTSTALRHGMEVFVQPRLYDRSQEEVLQHMAEAARQAERQRRGDNVKFVTGCEHFLFTPGILPGATFMDRIRGVENIPETEWPAIVGRFREFMGKAVDVTRREFRGKITYGSAAGADSEWNDWSLFDLVGLDYYQYFKTDAEYTEDLGRYRQWGKPIMVLEFGCCTFTGAAEAGGMGWDVLDFEADPPVIKPGIVRDEREQADHVARMLRVFDQEKLAGAHLYSVISPDLPHHPANRDRDYDIAAYSLFKAVRERFDDESSPYRLEPKQSYHAFRRHNC